MSDWHQTLAELQAAGLIRKPVTLESAQGPRVRIGGRDYDCWCSNDYLGMANHPALIQAAKRAADEFGTGAGASRLVCGTMSIHRRLEEAIAKFKQTESALVFATGYMANVGTISSLVGRGDSVYCDRLNHASIFDGVRLSGANLRVYPHKDVDALDRLLDRQTSGAKLVVTDTVFSMDGDIAPLPDLVDVCERRGATLMVDEAHATGVLGATGHGAIELFKLEGRVPVIMGTLSKAVGSLGGFVAGSSDLTALLVNRARSFIYSTALPPPVCAASLAGLRLIENEPERVAALWTNTRLLHDALRNMGWDIGSGETPITPLIIGEANDAVAVSKKLFGLGHFAPAIRPPTVPENTARLRLTPTAAHNTESIKRLAEALTAMRLQTREESK